MMWQGVGVFVLVAMAQQAVFEKKQRIIRLRSNGSPPELTLPRKCSFHVYLSHYWATGHYPAAHIQKEVQALLPGCRAFHPDLVDDAMEHMLELEQYIAESLTVLVFLSNGFWSSANCLREVREAVGETKPIILVCEPNVGRGGQPVALSKLECPEEVSATIEPLRCTGI